MCNDSSSFSNMKKLEPPLRVMLGDRYGLEGMAEGTVVIKTLLPDGGTIICRLENAVFAPTVCLMFAKHPLQGAQPDSTKLDVKL